MKFEIRRAKNGWILEGLDPENPSAVVGVEAEDEHESFADFLREICQHYGPTDSKYSLKRIRIAVLPGRDYVGPLGDEYRESLECLRSDLDAALRAEQEEN